MYRIIVARVPKALNGVATKVDSITDPFDQHQLGNTGNKMLLSLDKDRGIKALPVSRAVTGGHGWARLGRGPAWW